MEHWKDIPEYENLYQASSLGEIKSLSKDKITKGGVVCKTKDKILKPKICKNGYCHVVLYKGGKKKFSTVHLIIAKTFLNHSLSGRQIQVDHINNNKKDNRVVNLQLLSARENSVKSKKIGRSLPTGVSKRRIKGNYQADIVINKKRMYLGVYDTPELASQAYLTALKSS